VVESQERASESETPIRFAKSKPARPITAAAENRNVLWRYSVALLSFAFSLILRLSLSSEVGVKVPYIPFIPAIMVSGWYGGLGPGLLVTVCSAIAAVYLFLEPVSSLRITNQGDLVGLLLFLAVGSLISWLNEVLRRARHEAQSELLARTRSEEALQKEQEKLRDSNSRTANILESITDEFTAVDREWRFIYINERALNSMRKAKRKELLREDLVGKTLWKLFPEYVGSVHYHKFHEAMREQKTIHFEGYSLMTNRWVEVHAYPSEVGLSIYSRDITERKRAEEQLAYHAHLLENVYDAVIATDERFVLTAWNKGAEQMYGWRADEVLGRNVLEVIPWGLSDEERVKARKELSEAGRRHVEVTMYRKDGTPVYVDGTGIALRGEQGQITGYLRIHRNITGRKRAEEERAQLLRRLMAAQEDERRRIAREMHDQFGQEVSALTLKLAALKGAHGRQSELGEQLGALEAIARQLDQDLDFLIWEMRPTALDDLGLVIALSNYVENWSKHFAVNAELHASGMEKHRLTCEVETVLYRLTQEALTNIAKHARAANVHILLEHRLDHISLIIEDDGVGFDAEKIFDTGHTGLGLIGMRERAALVDGKLEIESHPGGGTTIVIRVRSPVVPKREEQDATFEHSLSRRS
jgi:PAS domain S-box-containing protein